MSNKEQLIIVGPCAGENQKQMNETVQWASQQPDVLGIRGNLWKPRTSPGFEGHGVDVLSWELQAIRAIQGHIDLIISTEVIIPDHVTFIARQLEKFGANNTKIILWLGSRNQNHIIQREIAKRINDEMPHSTRLMVKNQPWRSSSHWPGIVEHVNTHLSMSRLILCHRGFDPGNDNNPDKLRNVPDFEEAMRVKEITGLPMLNDPSHEGGNVEAVLTMYAQSLKFNFDGHLIEAHPNPTTAITDAKQQLTFHQVRMMLDRELS